MKKLLFPILAIGLILLQSCELKEVEPTTGIANFEIKTSRGIIISDATVSIYANEQDAASQSNVITSIDTDSAGSSSFTLPGGSYVYRATSIDPHLADRFDTLTVVNGDSDNHNVRLHIVAGTVNLLVKSNSDNTLSEVVISIYLNEVDAVLERNAITSAVTDNTGIASITIKGGDYAFRAVSQDSNLQDFVSSFTLKNGDTEGVEIILE